MLAFNKLTLQTEHYFFMEFFKKNADLWREFNNLDKKCCNFISACELQTCKNFILHSSVSIQTPKDLEKMHMLFVFYENPIPIHLHRKSFSLIL